MTFDEAKRYLLARAKELNVDLEVLATETRELTLAAFEGTLNESTQATQGGLGLRVVVNGKVGYASTEERSQEALEWALSEAKENAELLSGGSGFLPEGQALGKRDLLSEGLSAPIEEKAAAALAFEADLRKDSRLKQVTLARYTEREVQVALASTRGADGGYRTGMAGLLGWFVVQEGEGLKEGMDYAVKREFHALEPGTTAQEALARAARHLGATPLKTGKYTAYFEPRAFAQLLQVFLFMVSGKAVMEGKSRLKDKLGRAVAAPTVTLRDDPTLADGLSSRPFDSEGTPARPVTLIEKGVLTSFLHNSETAAALGQPNTGHASRSYKGTLGVEPTNVMLEPGSGIALERGVVVTDLMGVHAGANPISGDVSLQAFGLLVEAGEVRGPVDNFALSGNLLELLGRISALGETIAWEYQGAYIGTPMVEIPEVSFAGS